jgi:hypothetical protein
MLISREESSVCDFSITRVQQIAFVLTSMRVIMMIRLVGEEIWSLVPSISVQSWGNGDLSIDRFLSADRHCRIILVLCKRM